MFTDDFSLDLMAVSRRRDVVSRLRYYCTFIRYASSANILVRGLLKNTSALHRALNEENSKGI